jgi:predicted dinucleotide-binding enzyme
MNKTQLIEIVQNKLGAGATAADALEAVIQAVTPPVRKKAAPRKRTASPAQPMSLQQALKRDVVVTTVRSPKQVDVETAAVLGKTQSLRKLRSSLGWK